MLGRFLELALVVDDPGTAWMRYQEQGFAAAASGDVWHHAYGVVACHGLAIGLHARGDEELGIVFVRPDVAALHRELTALGLTPESASLGSDVFNELALREPGGVLLRVLEARSFSPPPELPDQTVFGRFQALSLPVRDLDRAAEFWQRLGFQTAPIAEPWDGFVLRGAPIACHSRRALAEPALLFHNDVANPRGEDYTLQRTGEGLAIILLGYDLDTPATNNYLRGP